MTHGCNYAQVQGTISIIEKSVVAKSECAIYTVLAILSRAILAFPKLAESQTMSHITAAKPIQHGQASQLWAV